MKFWSKNSPQSRKNQWFSMKFIKNLARPLLLDFAGALKKTLILEKLFWSSIHTLPFTFFPFLTLFFAVFRQFLYEVFFLMPPLPTDGLNRT